MATPHEHHTHQAVRAVVPHARSLARRAARHLAQPVHILRGYRRADLRADALAGLTVAVVMLPQAIAYATIAELPPHYGLYTAIVASIAGALWGSSRALSTGPTNAASLLLLSVLSGVAVVGSPGYLVGASVMAVLVGLMRIAFGFAGLGVLVNFVSRAVLAGFMTGVAVLIAVGQLPRLLGLPSPDATGAPGTLAAVGRSAATAHLPSVAIGLGTIAVTLAVNRISRRFPGSLIALVLATAAVVVAGADRLGVRVVGELPGALPRPTDLAAALRFLQAGDLSEILVGALALALLGLVEAVSISRSIARTSGQRLDVDQEFVGQGVANLATGLLGGYVSSGSFTRSAVNHEAGARTQMAAVASGCFVLVGALLLEPWLASLPQPAIAGVLMLVAWGMIDRAEIVRVVRTSPGEGAVLGVTFVATLAAPLELAVLAGVLFSLVLYLHRASLPRVFPVVPDDTHRHFVERPDAPECPQLAVMSIRGDLFFGATQHVEEEILGHRRTHRDQRFLLLRMHGVDRCDYTGLQMLEDVVSHYRARGGDVFLVQVRPQVRELMEHGGFLEHLGAGRILAQEEAIDRLFDTVIDPAYCVYHCPHRVFAECHALPKAPGEVRIEPSRPAPIPPHHFLAMEDALALLRLRDAVVVDVREPDEFRSGHVAGAISLPLRRVLEAPHELPSGRPLLLVCRTGRRSHRALRVVAAHEREGVFALRGGILSWRAAGHPLEVEPEPDSG